MLRWLLVGLFIALVAALAVIVRWEFSRVRSEPRLMAGAVKRYLQAEHASPQPPARAEAKRGFDAWD